MKYKVPFIKPSFPSADKVANDYEKIIESNWFTNFGPFEQRFSAAVSEYIGNDVDVCTVANATLGLQIATNILFKKNSNKNKVLIPSFTFAAGPEMLILNGLEPVFIDIDASTWQPSLDQARDYLENDNKFAGILLCNIFGVGNRDVELWEKLAENYSIPLVIDSAAGFGSLYTAGEPIGARGDCEIFSLHATKPFAVGEGGLIISRNKNFISELRQFENFGFDSQKKISKIGTNAKLQELNCAIGLRQLESFNDRLVHRRKSLEYYKQKLSTLGYKFQINDELSTVPFVSTLAISPEVAQKVENSLLGNGVEARKYYAPLHKQSLLVEHASTPGVLSVTEDIYSRILSLPLHDAMSEKDIDFIVDIIRASYEKS